MQLEAAIGAEFGTVLGGGGLAPGAFGFAGNRLVEITLALEDLDYFILGQTGVFDDFGDGPFEALVYGVFDEEDLPFVFGNAVGALLLGEDGRKKPLALAAHADVRH
jgi:hypothetical protein